MKFFFSISLLLFFNLSSYAKTIRVGKTQLNHSIQTALKAAVAGDTVLVEFGIYREQNILIDKSIKLIGLNFPVLDGENKYEVISVNANAVVIDGFRIVHSGVSSIEDHAGIRVSNSRDVVIRNNLLDDTFFGIYIHYGTNCLIEKNTLTGWGIEEQQSGNGIHCWKSDSMRILANTITGHRDGIYFEFVTNSIIWKNISYKNLRYGLHFMFSNNDAYTCNMFRNNGAGVAVMFSQHVTMFNNFFEENWGDGAYGLLLKEISDSHIENNRFTNNTISIYMEGASRVKLHRNLFDKNGWAMKIQASCMDVTVNNNNFKGNTFDVSTNGSLVLNNFNNNYWDKYEGYDLDKNMLGDIPYRPVSLYGMIIEQNPTAMILFRSFMTSLLDKTERVIPSLTPEHLKDDHPLMKPLPL